MNDSNRASNTICVKILKYDVQFSILWLQQAFELAVFNFTGSIFVYICDQFLNIYSHFKLSFYNLNELVGIDEPTSISFSTHWYKSVHCIFFNSSILLFLLLCDYLLKLIYIYVTIVTVICFWNHLEYFLFSYFLSHHLHQYLQFTSINGCVMFLNKCFECLLTFFFFFRW